MLQWQSIDTVTMADGTVFELAKHDDEWTVRVQGRMLMSSRVHDSEEALAESSLDRCDDPHAVLVGGLGLGFTLRAVLDRVEEDAVVTVAELVPALVAWNRTHLAPLHDRALEDPRVEVVEGDVYDTLKRSPRAFDVVLLDVDNGPVGLSAVNNNRLYTESGMQTCYRSLKPGGVLTVWSAGEDKKFERRMLNAGFDVEVVRVAARSGSRARHVLFVGLVPG